MIQTLIHLNLLKWLKDIIMHVDPTPEQFDTFKSLDREKPLNMLNLVKLRDRADYADGHKSTGAEAYAAYGKESGPIFAGVGGKIIWRGSPKAMMIGPKEEIWDIAFIADYPSLNAFLAMIMNPAYQAIVFHRQAAVADSRLLANHELTSSSEFG
ncbi:MAG: DUF1330 domain-containing protein [Amylibacter sp.]|nr:DUF1330 domain-containing protein [Amylibacter sp.]